MTTPYQGSRKPRWLEDLSNEQHHSLDMISASKIKHFIKYSPSSFYEKYILKSVPKFQPTESMIKGTLFHMLMLEPDKFNKYVYKSNDARNTKRFKDFVEKELEVSFNELTSENPCSYYHYKGLTKEEYFFLKDDEYQTLLDMKSSVLKHKRAKLFFEGDYETEKSGVGYCKESGLDLCIRPDLMRKNCMVDIKTIKSLDLKNLNYQMYDLGYYLQCAHYLRVGNIINPERFKKFFFLFVESVAPYEVCLVQMSAIYLDHAARKYNEALFNLAVCMTNDDFPRLDSGELLTLEPPSWALYR